MGKHKKSSTPHPNKQLSKLKEPASSIEESPTPLQTLLPPTMEMGSASTPLLPIAATPGAQTPTSNAIGRDDNNLMLMLEPDASASNTSSGKHLNYLGQAEHEGIDLPAEEEVLKKAAANSGDSGATGEDAWSSLFKGSMAAKGMKLGFVTPQISEG